MNVSSGTQIDASGFNFGAGYTATYVRSPSSGAHAYTFVFGFRSSGHAGYDVAVDVPVAVGPSAFTLQADTAAISVAGGDVAFTLAAGAGQAGRNYLLFATLSGTSPGTPLPGGLVTLPLHRDVFTDLSLVYANTAFFPGSLGAPDATGAASAGFDTGGPFPAGAIGLTAHFADALFFPWDQVSNPLDVTFVP